MIIHTYHNLTSPISSVFTFTGMSYFTLTNKTLILRQLPQGDEFIVNCKDKKHTWKKVISTEVTTEKHTCPDTCLLWTHSHCSWLRNDLFDHAPFQLTSLQRWCSALTDTVKPTSSKHYLMSYKKVYTQVLWICEYVVIWMSLLAGWRCCASDYNIDSKGSHRQSSFLDISLPQLWFFQSEVAEDLLFLAPVHRWRFLLVAAG